MINLLKKKKKKKKKKRFINIIYIYEIIKNIII